MTADSATTFTAQHPLLRELSWRGLIHQCTDVVGMEKLLGKASQSVYIGFDPTADSLHVGNFMQLMTLRRFQQHGLRPLAIVGGATGMIGDPSGKSEERNLLSEEQLGKNVESVAAQMKKFLDFEGEHAAKLINNFDWMSKFSYLEFLRDVGKSFPVGAMMGKESVRSRLDSEAGLSYTEFSYMLLQAYDFVHLHRSEGCRIQAGGSDQWGNITAGIDLGRRMGTPTLFGITAPLLTTSEGKKMGKTERGSIWLDADRTSPYEFYQYWKNIADADVMKCIAFLTEIPRDRFDELAAATRDQPQQRAAQNELASWLTRFVHGEDGLRSAEGASKKLFGGDLSGATDQSLLEMFADVPSGTMQRERLSGEGLWVVEGVVAAGLAKSNGEARREIKGGGIYVDNQRITDDQLRLSESHLTSESVMVLRRGKKKYALLKFSS